CGGDGPTRGVTRPAFFFDQEPRRHRGGQGGVLVSQKLELLRGSALPALVHHKLGVLRQAVDDEHWSGPVVWHRGSSGETVLSVEKSPVGGDSDRVPGEQPRPGPHVGEVVIADRVT